MCRLQTANDSVSLQLSSESRDTGRKLDRSLPDIQKQDYPHSRMENENLPSVNHTLPPDSSYNVFDTSDNSCNDLQLGMKGLTLHSEGEKESQHGALFDHKNVGETTCCEKPGSFNESSITCAKDGFTVDHTSEKVSEVDSPLGTDPGELHLNATERRQMEKVDTSHLNHKSSTDGFDMDDNFDKERKNSVNNIILDDAQIDSQTDLLVSKNVPLTPACRSSMANTAIDSSEVATFDHPISEFEKESSSARNIEGGPSLSSPRIDSAVDERPKILSSDEQDLATFDGSLTEDDLTFLSALHDVEDPFSSEVHHSHQSLVAPHTGVEGDSLQGLNTQSFRFENITHDRSFWTPMEIETATGNADCSLIEHPLKLKSTYTETEVEDSINNEIFLFLGCK